jgi:hypothetical protein
MNVKFWCATLLFGVLHCSLVLAAPPGPEVGVSCFERNIHSASQDHLLFNASLPLRRVSSHGTSPLFRVFEQLSVNSPALGEILITTTGLVARRSAAYVEVAGLGFSVEELNGVDNARLGGAEITSWASGAKIFVPSNSSQATVLTALGVQRDIDIYCLYSPRL